MAEMIKCRNCLRRMRANEEGWIENATVEGRVELTCPRCDSAIRDPRREVWGRSM